MPIWQRSKPRGVGRDKRRPKSFVLQSQTWLPCKNRVSSHPASTEPVHLTWGCSLTPHTALHLPLAAWKGLSRAGVFMSNLQTCKLQLTEQRARGRVITAAWPGLPATTLCLGIKLWSVSHVKQSSKRAGGGSGCLNPETTLSWCLFFPLGPPRQRGGPGPGNQPPSSRVCPPQWDVLCLTPPPRNPLRPRLRGDSAPCEQCLLRDEIQGQWVEAGEGWESGKGGATPSPGLDCVLHLHLLSRLDSVPPSPSSLPSPLTC